MNYRITILCENSVGPLLSALGEHGFSALIEPSEGDPVLFDTGQGSTLLHNARVMKKNLSAVSSVVISHGHYDHTGGLLPLLQECGPKEVFGHSDIFAPRFRVKDNGDYIPIGIPQNRETLEKAGATFNLGDSFRELSPGIFLTGEVPRRTSFETGDRGLYRDCSGNLRDVTLDDQSLVLDSSRGLVVILGCCHSGLVNTLEHITETTSRRDFYAVIGGTHLGFCEARQIEQTIAAIKKMGIKKLAAGHCTGFAASARLSHELPNAFHPANVGYMLEC
ncbi:MAG: MBL fold metallo-hydrolase [Geobacteraceae bacterium GWC2_48_7]|nr:MAG: MBL fold metallo-hydrolase [Geobacteraceae bacterium GWC2_48_7]